MKLIKARTLQLYFFVLLATAVPFWILGDATHVNGLPFNMQLNVLIVLALPLITILFISHTYGAASLKQVLRDCLPTPRTSSAGLAVAFLTMPVTSAVVYAITQPWVPFDGYSVPLYLIPIYFLIYYVAAAFEEIGWTWFATPILAKRMSVLRVGLTVGMVWSLIHVWPWFQQNGWWFMVGMVMLSVLNRIVMTRLYLKKGRLLWLNITYHAMINTTLTLFHPGSPYANPLTYTAVLFTLMVAAWAFSKYHHTKSYISVQ